MGIGNRNLKAEVRLREINKLVPEYQKDIHEHSMAIRGLSDTVSSLLEEKREIERSMCGDLTFTN